jgi:hypothetical protein
MAARGGLAIGEIRGQRNVQVSRVSHNLGHGPTHAVGRSGDDLDVYSVARSDLPYGVRGDFLVAWMDHLVLRRQIDPQPEAGHHPVTRSWHLLVEDSPTGGYPLDIAPRNGPGIADAVPMANDAGKVVGHRLNATVWMHGRTRQVVGGILGSEVIEKQESEVGSVTLLFAAFLW